MFLNNIKKQLDDAEVISFDIFDTLLLRPYVNPSDLFYHMERYFQIPGFATSRKNAEQQAWNKYRKNKEDITLNEIYCEIEEKYKKYKKKEVEFEIKTSILNNEIYQVYQYALKIQKKVVFTSDMYLPKDVILKMLIKNGYTQFDKLYVSCEYGKLKQTGSLFKVLQTDYPGKSIFHIGDNEISDIKSARNVGIKTAYYENIYSRYSNINKNINTFVQKYKNIPEASVIVKLAAIRTILQSSNSYWNNFGYMYEGCSSLAFVQWIFKNLPQTKDILFIARDGYTLQKVFTELYGNKYKTHYIYAPRSLNLLCQLNFEREGRFAFEHTKTLIDYYKKRSKQLFDAPCITTGEEGVKYIDKHIDIFKKLAEMEKNNYIEYLKKQKLQSDTFVLIDTVSMFYSAQKFISSLMPEKEIKGFYYLIQTGAEQNQNAFSFKKQSPYSSDLSLIEFMMSSPESPILRVENGEVVYKDEISEQEEKRQIACEEMSKGAIDFTKDIKNIFGDIKLDFPAELITDWIMFMIDNPTDKDKQEFLKTKCAYDPEHKNYHPVFPQWYNNNILKHTDKSTKIISKTKFSILGLPFYCHYSEQRRIYTFFKLPLLSVKERGNVIRYKLFNLLPIFKIRKIYKY